MLFNHCPFDFCPLNGRRCQTISPMIKKMSMKNIHTVVLLIIIVLQPDVSASMDWSERHHPLSIRESHAMACNQTTGITLLYGATQEIPASETWSLIDLDWQLIRPASVNPGSCYHHAMTYSYSQDEILLFGGVRFKRNSEETWSEILDELWAWNGSDWRIMEPASTSPPPRYNHAMVYDSYRDRIVIFGGQDLESYYDDTWEWDGTDWYLMAPSSTRPIARMGHAMAYDSLRHITLMFGGWGELDGDYDNFWQWDGTDWEILESAGDAPEGRTDGAMVYDSHRDRVVMFGGATNGPWKKIWEWDGNEWHRINTETAPGSRDGDSMIYDETRDLTIMFGGNFTNETWVYDGSDWTRIFPEHLSPCYRFNHEMVYDSHRQTVVLYGGAFHNFAFDMTDTWEWDGEEWTEIETAQHPPGMSGFSMIFDSNRSETFIFGGWEWDINGGHLVNTMWVYDGTDWQAVYTTGATPSPRSGIDLAYDTLRQRAILFGGWEGTDQYGRPIATNETWAWDGTCWTLLNPETTPPVYWSYEMVYDIHRDRIVIFGGHGEFYYNDDVWEFDGMNWKQVIPASFPPPWRSGHEMIYDSHRRRCVLFGGDDSTRPPFGDTWEWDGYDWYEITPATDTPRPLDESAMAYDLHRNCSVLFGGFGAYYGQETWEYYNTDLSCCENLGVTLNMASDYFEPGDECWCTASVCNNTGMALNGFPLFVLLDVYGHLFWGPEFTDKFDSYLGMYPSFPENETEIEVISPFTWPQDVGSGDGIRIHAAMTDPRVSFLYGKMDTWEFGWGE